MGGTHESCQYMTASYNSVKYFAENYEKKKKILSNNDQKILDDILGYGEPKKTEGYSVNEYNTISQEKKYNLNILYYDENLIGSKENSDNCSFIEMNTNGTFYGCHNFKLFKIVCEKIKRNQKQFILISSGSAAKKIYDYCYNIKEIREYFIYCFQKDKYIPLMNQYPKLKAVYNIFNDLKNKLYSINEIKMDFIKSSNLITFEDYSRIQIKLHYEFIRKYSLYKILKSKNLNESEFLDFIAKKYPNFLNTAKQLFPNKNETINYFLGKLDESKDELNKTFEIDNNILDDNIEKYIKNYTYEGFYYKNLNKFLREGNFEDFRKLSTHVAKFIFKLYDYREKNLSSQKSTNLYRRMCLKRKDIEEYQQLVNRVICYPSFTSTSIKKNGFIPTPYDSSFEHVMLIIEQNNTKSVVSIRQYSDYKGEEEYLFLPFSFFKIKKVEIKTGNMNNPHIFHLIAINSDKSIEDMFLDFFINETDNLNPEGLDFLLLCNNNTKIKLNDIYFT